METTGTETPLLSVPAELSAPPKLFTELPETVPEPLSALCAEPPELSGISVLAHAASDIISPSKSIIEMSLFMYKPFIL